MQPVNAMQLVDSLQRGRINPGQPDAQWQPSAGRVEQAVNYFFAKLESFSPSRFKSMYGDVARLNMVKAEWAPVIGRLTRADIDAGFAKAKAKAADNDSRYQWPDVSTFIGLCRIEPADLGLPDAEEAYREACHKSHNPGGHNWSHAAVREAGRLTGWYELRGNSDSPKKTRDLYFYHYRVLVDRAVRGEDLTATVMQALTDQSTVSPAEAAQQESEAQLRATMVASGINPNGGRAEFLKFLNRL